MFGREWEGGYFLDKKNSLPRYYNTNYGFLEEEVLAKGGGGKQNIHQEWLDCFLLLF